MERVISEIITKLFDQDVSVQLTRPDPKFGDFATNVALQFRLQNRRTDIARDDGIQPAIDAEIADQARYRRFAVAAGNRNQH